MTVAYVMERSLLDIAAAQTPIGSVAVAVVDGRVVATSIGHRDVGRAESAVARVVASSRPEDAGGVGPPREADLGDLLSADEVAERLVQYAAGEVVDLNWIPIAVDDLTPFQRRVVAACRAIPYGCTRTYGELAADAGRPGAARAVGRVMATNRIPLLTPCHRVVASSGKLGGFSAPRGVALKRQLLAMEEQAVGGAGRAR